MLGSAGAGEDEGPYAVPCGPAVSLDGVPDHERRVALDTQGGQRCVEDRGVRFDRPDLEGQDDGVEEVEQTLPGQQGPDVVADIRHRRGPHPESPQSPQRRGGVGIRMPGGELGRIERVDDVGGGRGG